MVDSKNKGVRGETVVKDKLKELTKLKWERIPNSGALNEKHGLKGDLYIPNYNNIYCVEVKNYEDDHLTSQILTAKNPQLLEWWEQALRQAKQVNKKPLLIFKFNRSKIFVAFEDLPNGNYRILHIEANGLNFSVALLDDWIKHDNPKFICQ